MSVVLPLKDVLDHYANGDETSWADEFAWLDANHAEKLETLEDSIRREGIKTPVLLGNDDRVWDGHHRLRVALSLGLETVPVKHA